MIEALDRFAHHLGRGLVASVAGTAAMTISSTVEMRVRSRAPSDAPGRAAAQLLRVRVQDDPATGRLARLGHVMTGFALGAARGALGFAGLREPAASALFLGVSLAPDAAGLPAVGIAPPPWRWRPVEIAASLGHHAVFTRSPPVPLTRRSNAARDVAGAGRGLLARRALDLQGG